MSVHKQVQSLEEDCEQQKRLLELLHGRFKAILGFDASQDVGEGVAALSQRAVEEVINLRRALRKDTSYMNQVCNFNAVVADLGCPAKEHTEILKFLENWLVEAKQTRPITKNGLNALARDIKELVEGFYRRHRVAHLDLADIRPVLEKHLAANNTNGHQIFKNEQELDVCTVCGAGEQELLDDTCTGHLKRMRLEDKRLFDQEIKAWKDATGRVFPYEAKRDLETAGRQVLDWQEATGCADAATYKVMRKDFHGEWQRATGCASPDVIAERLATFRKQHTAQANNITELQKQLYAVRREAREAVEQLRAQLRAQQSLWKNRWETFKGHVHELGHRVGCEQREQELLESFLLRCTEVVELMVKQKQGPGPLQWHSAAPLSTLPVGYLHVCRVDGRHAGVDLVTINGLMASAGCEHWLLGPLPELPPPPPGAPKPEMPDLLTLRCLEDDKLYVGTLHPVLHRYQVFKGGRWFEAPMNEFTEVAPC